MSHSFQGSSQHHSDLVRIFLLPWRGADGTYDAFGSPSFCAPLIHHHSAAAKRSFQTSRSVPIGSQHSATDLHDVYGFIQLLNHQQSKYQDTRSFLRTLRISLAKHDKLLTEGTTTSHKEIGEEHLAEHLEENAVSSLCFTTISYLACHTPHYVEDPIPPRHDEGQHQQRCKIQQKEKRFQWYSVSRGLQVLT